MCFFIIITTSSQLSAERAVKDHTKYLEENENWINEMKTQQDEDEEISSMTWQESIWIPSRTDS